MLVKDAFVIMPFSPTASCADWTEIYEHVFKRSFSELGWNCERAQPETGSLIASIVDRLSTATVVLADLTDRNANVFYELGVRHALSPRTIIVAQGTEHVPSDLKGYWQLVYGTRPAQVSEFKENLARVLKKIEDDPEKSDNPVSDYLSKSNKESSRTINKENIKKLNALWTELSGNVQVFSLLSDPTSKLPAQEMLLFSDCLSLLLQTQYVDVGPEILARAYELHRRIALLSREGQDTKMADEALDLGTRLMRDVGNIRNQIQKGTFVEPPTTSIMVWAGHLPSLKQHDLILASDTPITNCLVCNTMLSDDLNCPHCNSSSDSRKYASKILISACRSALLSQSGKDE